MSSRFCIQSFAAAALALAAVIFSCGCGGRDGHPQLILVETTGRTTRFSMNHTGWPAPFTWPGVTEVSVASDETNREYWHLTSEDPAGVPARELTIVYGSTPPGFRQTVPGEGQAPERLVIGRNYMVAAGGKQCLFGVVFALPETTSRPTSRPGREADFPNEDAWRKMRATSRPGEEPAGATSRPTPPENRKRSETDEEQGG